MGVVLHARGDVAQRALPGDARGLHALRAHGVRRHGVEKARLDPGVARTAGVARRAHDGANAQDPPARAGASGGTRTPPVKSASARRCRASGSPRPGRESGPHPSDSAGSAGPSRCTAGSRAPGRSSGRAGAGCAAAPRAGACPPARGTCGGRGRRWSRDAARSAKRRPSRWPWSCRRPRPRRRAPRPPGSRGRRAGAAWASS